MTPKTWLLRSAVIAVLIGLWPVLAHAETISAADAPRYVGQSATVCGIVASTNYAVRSKGQPTFLSIDKTYPDQIFTVVIWGTHRSKFGTPEVAFLGKRICVTGVVHSYRGKPEIVLSDPVQLKYSQ